MATPEQLAELSAMLYEDSVPLNRILERHREMIEAEMVDAPFVLVGSDGQPVDTKSYDYQRKTYAGRRSLMNTYCELCLVKDNVRYRQPDTLHGIYLHRAAEDMDIRNQMPILYAWAHQPAVKIIECGTRGGYSTVSFLAGIERSGTGGQLWSVDIEPPLVPAWWDTIPFWSYITADSVAPEALEFCPDDADILFSDTSHYYDQTLNELLAYASKVKPGGIILVHDVDAIGENATAMHCPDVAPALDEFCRRTGLSWYMHPGWNGLGVVEIPR